MSALAVEGAKVTSTTYEGRPALLVTAPAGPAPLAPLRQRRRPRRRTRAAAYDAVAMTIDRDTWLPVRVERTFRGEVVEAWWFSDVQLDPPLTAGDFAVRLPDGASWSPAATEGFRRLSLQNAGAAVHGRLFVPAALPDGFALSLAAVRGPEPTLQ